MQHEWQNGVRTLEKPHYFFILGVAKGGRKEKGKDTKGSALGCCCNWVKRKTDGKGLCSLIQSKRRKVFPRYFPLVFHLLCIKGRAVSILLHSVIQSWANHRCCEWRQSVGNLSFQVSPTFVRHAAALTGAVSGDFGKTAFVYKDLKDTVKKRQVYMTKEPKDNSAMSWAWVKVSRSKLGSDLLSTTLVTMCNELWAEVARPRRRRSATQPCEDAAGWVGSSTATFASP